MAVVTGEVRRRKDERFKYGIGESRGPDEEAG